MAIHNDVDSLLSGRDAFPQTAAVVPCLGVVDGDAAEALRTATKASTLPHFATIAAYDLHGIVGAGGAVAAEVSLGVMVRGLGSDDERAAVNPMVTALLALAAARTGITELFGPHDFTGEPMVVAGWPGELRHRGRRMAAVEVEAVEGGVIVGMRFNVFPEHADRVQAAFLRAFAAVMARYELAGGDLRLAGLQAELEGVRGALLPTADRSGSEVPAPIFALVAA